MNNISRRQAIKTFGVGTMAFLAACAKTTEPPRVIDDEPQNDTPITEPDLIETPKSEPVCSPDGIMTLEEVLHKNSIVVPAYEEKAEWQWIGDALALRNPYGCPELRLTTEGTQPGNIEGSDIIPVRNEFFNMYQKGNCDTLALRLGLQGEPSANSRDDPQYIGIRFGEIKADNFDNLDTGYVVLGAAKPLGLPSDIVTAPGELLKAQYDLLRQSAFARGGRGMNSHSTLYLANEGDEGMDSVWKMVIGQKEVGEKELFPVATVEYNFLNPDQAKIRVAEVHSDRHFDAGLMYNEQFEGNDFTQMGIYKVGSWDPNHVSVADLSQIRNSLGL